MALPVNILKLLLLHDLREVVEYEQWEALCVGAGWWVSEWGLESAPQLARWRTARAGCGTHHLCHQVRCRRLSHRCDDASE